MSCNIAGYNNYIHHITNRAQTTVLYYAYAWPAYLAVTNDQPIGEKDHSLPNKLRRMADN